MLEILNERRKSLPFSFEIIAAHINVSDSGYSVNEEYLYNFCKELNILYRSETIEAGINNSPKKSPCFLCSWHRRKKLFDLTKELNCNKLCFGHHRDDALETLMINMIYHGSISSLPYNLKMFGGRVHLVRPLIDIYEKDIQEYASYKNYLLPKKECQHGENTKRKFVRELLENLNKTYEKSKINIFNSMNHIYTEYLPERKNKL